MEANAFWYVDSSAFITKHRHHHESTHCVKPHINRLDVLHNDDADAGLLTLLIVVALSQAEVLVLHKEEFLQLAEGVQNQILLAQRERSHIWTLQLQHSILVM